MKIRRGCLLKDHANDSEARKRGMCLCRQNECQINAITCKSGKKALLSCCKQSAMVGTYLITPASVLAGLQRSVNVSSLILPNDLVRNLTALLRCSESLLHPVDSSQDSSQLCCPHCSLPGLQLSPCSVQQDSRTVNYCGGNHTARTGSHCRH